jgi:hypothetical protein
MHLDGTFGHDDPVYCASLTIRGTAPRFFSSTILGVKKSLADTDDTEPYIEKPSEGTAPLEVCELNLPPN